MEQRRIPPPPQFDETIVPNPRLTSNISQSAQLTSLSQTSQQKRSTRKPGGAALEVAKAEARKVGGNIPGDDPEEVKQWVAERLKNWPSRANVARKLEEARKAKQRGGVGGELGMICEAYGSSEDEGDGEGRGRKGGGRGGRGRGRREGKGGRGRGKEKKKGRGKGRRGDLLRMLLEKEIRMEQNVVLQCFRFLVNTQFLTSEKEDDYRLP